MRRQLATYVLQFHRPDLAALFSHPESERFKHARTVAKAIELLPTLAAAEPLIGDDVGQWLPPRVAKALQAHGIKTLAALTVRIPRRRRWWTAIPGVGAASARQIEAFFAAHPQLTERARALVVVDPPQDLVPWERIVVPRDVDGSQGTFRAPHATCTLSADNDYDAVHAWLALHESQATQRAYRKEAERLILWAIVERGRALSSLTTEDAVAYRAFLRHPAPRTRWVGSSRPRSSPEWKPFAEGCRRGRLPTPCRHSHASHSLARGTELTSVRDNLCHASLYTTSIHLHGDEVKRATQIRAAFAERA